MTRVRNDVIRTTNERQVPWDSSSLTADVYLAGGQGLPVPQVAAVPQQAPPIPPEPRSNLAFDGRWRVTVDMTVHGRPARFVRDVDILGGRFELREVRDGSSTLSLDFNYEDEIVHIPMALIVDRSIQERRVGAAPVFGGEIWAIASAAPTLTFTTVLMASNDDEAPLSLTLERLR